MYWHIVVIVVRFARFTLTTRGSRVRILICVFRGIPKVFRIGSIRSGACLEGLDTESDTISFPNCKRTYIQSLASALPHEFISSFAICELRFRLIVLVNSSFGAFRLMLSWKGVVSWYTFVLFGQASRFHQSFHFHLHQKIIRTVQPSPLLDTAFSKASSFSALPSTP